MKGIEWKKWKQRAEKLGVSPQTLLMVLGFVGIVLIGMDPISKNEKEISSAVIHETQSSEMSAEEYADQLESQLSELLSKVNGVGTAHVMITLKSGYTYEYAKTEKTNNDYLEDYKSEIARKTQEKQTIEQNYLLIEDGNSNHPLITAKIEPEIKGVVVICEGGADPVVIERVIDTVKTALDIPSTRISVSKLSA